MSKKICVITGTRAEYGLLKPALIAIKKHPKLELQLIATGMHLIPEFGYTVREIERDGFNIDVKVDMMIANDTGGAMAKSIGVGIFAISQSLEQLKPDIVLVLGDRIEAFAATVAAAAMNIPVAHMSGGQVTGSIDESIRHAITKFAHIHFPRTSLHAKRIQMLGEEKWRIHVIGSACLDTIFDMKYISPPVLAKKYRIELHKPLLLVVQHPVTTEIEEAPHQMQETMEALVELQVQTILIYPNADAGGRKIIEVIERYKDYSYIHMYRNIPQNEYYSLMNIADILIGNSSSGLIEAPVFKLPVINIGTRQDGREKPENVIDVGYDRGEIVRMAKKILTDTPFREKLKNCTLTDGDGKTGKKIANILASIDISPKLLQKKLSYQL